METKLESPCKKCDKYPCNNHKSCILRQDYAKSFNGEDQMKVVDTNSNYRILLP